MGDYVLVLNAGSSSLKFCVYRRWDAQLWEIDARGQIDGLGKAPSFTATCKRDGGVVRERLIAAVRDTPSALQHLAGWLRSQYSGAHVLGVGHRVVHGGVRYTGPALVTPEVLADLRALIPLAPLHQPHNLAAIDAVSARLPGVPQVACFDTSFHTGRSAVAELVPLPRQICAEGIRRYGFHGLSYEYIAAMIPKTASELSSGRVIVAHLGSGASLCALQNGRSVDSTLGFTALDGLCMGTRPGALDPGVVLYLFQVLGKSASEVETILYKKSGLLGISGVSNDMRDLLGHPGEAARLAVDYFVYRAVKEIGGLTAVLGGLDGLIFTGGIGENSPEIRRRICQASAWLGVQLDADANSAGTGCISSALSPVSAWVIPTNEELMIARHTSHVLGLIEARA